MSDRESAAGPVRAAVDSRAVDARRPGPEVRVGTSGYNYAEWKGSFYPADLPAARMLEYYAARFGVVEINATFYRMPTAKILAGWAAATPERFAFSGRALT